MSRIYCRPTCITVCDTASTVSPGPCDSSSSAGCSSSLSCHGVRRRDRSPGGTAAAAVRGPRPLALDDADQDGLPDTLEAALAARFAPAVILDPQEANRPASIAWLLSRIGGVGRLDTDRGSFPAEVRAGSADPRDWVTYVHVYPRTDGRINIQYWFFYTYNEGPLFFNHDSDWEHITVDVDPSGVPRGVYFAQHGNNSPGVYRAWNQVRKWAKSGRRASIRWCSPPAEPTPATPTRLRSPGSSTRAAAPRPTGAPIQSGAPGWGAVSSTSASARPRSGRRRRSPTRGAGAARDAFSDRDRRRPDRCTSADFRAADSTDRREPPQRRSVA